MELIKFRIRNFRSIDDSGDITVAQLTSLVGRNESGKSNLLLALASLNPAGGLKPLNRIKDFPRGRHLEECKDDSPVVATHWKLSAPEADALGATLGGYGAAITEVSIRRGYAPTLWVDLPVIRPTAEKDEIESILKQLGPEWRARIVSIVEPDHIWQHFKTTVEVIADPIEWAAKTTAAAD